MRLRSPCKRFAIKDNGICDRSTRGLDGHNAKLHSFFSLRTLRVVTRESVNLRIICFWIADKPTEALFLASQKPVSGQLPVGRECNSWAAWSTKRR